MKRLLIFLTMMLSLPVAAGGEVGSKTVQAPPPARVALSVLDGKVVFDVQERVRFEYRNNSFDFNSGEYSITDGSLLLQRVRLGLKVEPVAWFRVYGQLQSAVEVSRRPKAPGVAASEGDVYLDLYQGWVELADYEVFPVGARVGRQLFNYGEQRLVGSFEWNNLGRTFDAARLRFQGKTFWGEAFAASVVVNRNPVMNYSDFADMDGLGRGQVFSGVYFSTIAVPAHTVDLYVFVLNQAHGSTSNVGVLAEAPPAGSQGGDPNGRSDFVTLGTRFKNDPAKVGGWEYDGEFAFQAGRLAGLDLTAFATHIGAGYNFLSVPWRPRIYLQYNFASGDGNLNDGRSTTFQNLFPTNHFLYGYMDLWSWQNMHNPSVSFSVQPLKDLTVGADFHLFWLATTQDAWYRANGLTPVRPLNAAARNANPYAGAELDLWVAWKPWQPVSLLAGYSRFFPGQYLRDTGPASPADFVYVQAGVAF